MARYEFNIERQGTSVAYGAAAIAFSLTFLGDAALAQTAPTVAASEDEAVLLEADSFSEDSANDIFTAEGQVEARYGERLLRADKVIYDRANHQVRAIGSVELVSANGDVQFAEELVVDDTLSVGVATGFSSRLQSGGTLAAGSGVRRADGSVALTRMVYTACPICRTGDSSPTWTLRARRAVQDKKHEIIAYRDAVLRFKGVPVLYTPYFAHPDPTVGRKSGLLPPNLGRNNRTGFFYTQPYLWAVDPYTDFTVAPQLFTKVNPLLNLDLRRRFYSGYSRFSGSVTYERDFDNQGDRFGDREVRGHVFGEGSFRLSKDWSWGFGAARTTDDLYIRRYAIQGAQERRGIYGGDETRLFSQINIVGRSEHAYTEITALSVQGLRFDDNSRTTPTVLPLSETTHIFTDPLLKGRLKLQGSSAVLLRKSGETDSARISASASYDFSKTLGPGVVVTPFLQGRSDAYRLAGGFNQIDTDADPLTPPEAVKRPTDYLVRTVGVGGVEARWPFVRPGKTVDLLIEPVGFAAYGSRNGNRNRIPNEDSISFELDESALFRPIATPNFDVFEPGARASFGLRAAATTGRGSLVGVAGRRWRDTLRPDLFNQVSNLDERVSDWVAGVDADFKPFNGNVRFRLDDNLNLERVDASASARFWRINVNARYFNVLGNISGFGPSSEIQGATDVRLTRRWTSGFGVRRDLDARTNLSQNAFIRYQDDCTFVEFSYARNETFDRSLGPTTVVALRIGLSTLGVIGASPAGR